jgi:hypothetical protein
LDGDDIMKKMLVCVVALALLLVSCQTKEESTMNRPTENSWRTIPKIEPPEIERNQKKISLAIPIEEEEALGVARALYTYNISELVEAEINEINSQGYNLQVTDISHNTYHVILTEVGGLRMIWKDGDDEPIYSVRGNNDQFFGGGYVFDWGIIGSTQTYPEE